MTELRLRPYTITDTPQVVEVINAAAAQTVGSTRAAVDGVGNIRLIRYVPTASEKIVAINPEGQIVGYAYLVSSEQGVINEVGGAVHPDVWGQGIGSRLLAWAESRSQALTQSAPAGVKCVLQANLYDAEVAAIQLFSTHGFAKVREWEHLVIDLAEPPQSPVIPNGLTLRPMDLENDWEVVGPTMAAAFANHWGALTLPPAEEVASETADEEEDVPEDDSYSNAPGFCFIVLAGEMVAGGVLCNAKLVERSDTGRVGSLFVHPDFQRQGIGRALMLTAFQAFWQHGMRRIILDTDAASFSATPKFYASLGMRLYRREFLYEKTVRAGQELRRLQL